MKKLLLIAIVACLSSCIQTEIKTIDGCEYIETTNYDGNILVKH